MTFSGIRAAATAAAAAAAARAIFIAKIAAHCQNHKNSDKSANNIICHHISFRMLQSTVFK